jgi:hypothetical protein
MVALKGKPDVGDRINTDIIAPLAKANQLSDMPDFNDAGKLGTGKEISREMTRAFSWYSLAETLLSFAWAVEPRLVYAPYHCALVK